jgi:hypothetical protein
LKLAPTSPPSFRVKIAGPVFGAMAYPRFDLAFLLISSSIF